MKWGKIIVCSDIGIYEKTGQECPNYENHEPMPIGYVEFHEYGKKLNKTHKNVKCPGCGKYRLWVERS